jgi:hypothetical protein
VGGAGNDGMGGGREKAGGLELPAESVRGGGLLEAESLFCILRGPTVGVSAWDSDGRRNSSSSGRPCLRPSMVVGQGPAMLHRATVCDYCGAVERAGGMTVDGPLFLETDAGTGQSPCL